MTTGIITIHDNLYSKASVNDCIILGKDNIGKVFNGDYVKINNDKVEEILQNNMENKILTGILEYYSDYKYSNNKKNIPRYKFNCFSKNYPSFLVSSKCKSKFKNNIIVTIKYLSWNETLPYGEIIKILGEINDINAIYESVLYKNELITKKFQITSQIKKQIIEKDIYNKKLQCTDFTKEYVFSVDPESTQDIDDALHFKKINENHFNVVIHISNVIDTLNLIRINHILNTNLVSSIYTPNKVYNMFPEILSNNYLSLIQNSNRYTISLVLDIKDNKIINKYFCKGIINNKKKFSYKTFENFFNINNEFSDLFNCIKNLDYKNLKYNQFDTHTFIEKLMTIYNCEAVSFLQKNNKKFIYRTQSFKQTKLPDNINNELQKFLNIINKSAALYSFENQGHHSLNIQNYTHITSPIRRFIDCYNQRILINILDNVGYNEPEINIDYINYFNQNIKKSERIFNKIKLKNYINENNIITIYLPEIKCSIRKKLKEKNTEIIFNIEKKDNTIIIENIHKKTTTKINMFKEYKFKIYCINNHPYPKFKIEILNF